MTDTEIESVLSGNELTAIYFWSRNCEKCGLLGPRIESVINETGIALSKVDVAAEQDVALQHDVLSLPTLIFFLSGRERLRLTSANISAAETKKACGVLIRISPHRKKTTD